MLGTDTFSPASPLHGRKAERFQKAIPLAMLAGLFFSASPALSQSPPPKPPATVQRETAKAIIDSPYENYLSLSYENDLIGDGTDRYYTSGVRLTYYNVNAEVPAFIDNFAEKVPGFDINATTSTFYTLGQNLYTPSDITQRIPDEDDRPYAAWLYGSIGLATTTQDHIDEVELTLGIVGPEALGEQTQKFIHRHLTDSPTPKGWNTQLDTEPGVILSWQRRWPRGFDGKWFVDFGDDWRLNVEPSANVSLGNIYTYAGSGLMLTFGPYQESLQDTPPRVRPAMTGSGFFNVPDQDWSWYLFTGIDGRAVARNIFLDGKSFDDDGLSVDKKPLVGDAVAGIAFTLHDYRLSYTANYRTKEFDRQEDDTFFGSLTLTTRF
jgi:lipid A 3-O-deacylase